VLAPDLVVGVDPESLSLCAAEVRARGYGLKGRRVKFRQCGPGRPLPFPTDSFDLVTCVSVLEFVPTTRLRNDLVNEMKRVARPGGHVFLSTPSPLRLREMHSKRWLGNLVRRDGYPWATVPWRLCAMFSDYDRLPIGNWMIDRALTRAGLPSRRLPPSVAEILAWTSAWQKLLARKPAPLA
jgi:SAM-dependent methyltransferase